MKKLELEDGELQFLIEATGAINIPGKAAHALAALQDKLVGVMNASGVVVEETKEND